jgi:hypothetical protein
MQIDKEIIMHFRNFIQSNDKIDEAQKILKNYRNIKISNYNLKDSRCIWMSLILYKFKKDMDVTEDLWGYSRSLIISLLKSDSNLENTIDKYLKEFTKWQNDDIEDLITQIGGNYYNLIQIKNSIENTKKEETINNWMPHYESLILKIRSYCKVIGILEKVEDFIFTFEQKKYDIVKEIMDKAYWEKIEQEIDDNNLDNVYNNLGELKTIILDIIPKNINNDYINEYFDIEYIKHLVDNKVLDREYLLKLFIFVIGILKDWDTEEFIEKYNNEINKIKNLNTTHNNFIRNVIQKMMVLSFDLKNRKAIWSIIFKK